MDETEEIDLFAYKPLKVTKKRASLSPTVNTPSKRRKTGEGTYRRRSAVKSHKSPLPSQKGPGIVELFAQMKKTPAKVQKSLSVCPLCQLPLDLLRSPSMVTSRVHLNDCQDRLSESGLVKRPPCPDWLDCRSREVVHYAKFDHSELARHRDLGLDSNQVGVHAPEEREDGNQEVREVEDYVDTGQRGMTSTKPDVKRGNTSLTMLRGSPPPRASLQNTSLASRRPSQLLNDPQQSSQRLVQNTLAAVRRLVVSCDNCEEEFESFQEKSSHICNHVRNGEEGLSGPPSISLLAARSPSPSQDVELPDDIGTEGQNNAEQSEGEIIEGHSEVAGPSGVSGEGAVPITPPSSPPDPIRAIAEKDSEELQLELDIDPSVLCTKLRVRVPLGRDKDDNSLPLSISAAYTSAAGSKQKSITDYFGGGKDSQQSKEVEEDSLTRSGFERVVERAKKKGFLAPSFASLEEKENKGGNRRQQKVPFYKLMKDTNLAVDAFNYGSIPGVSNYLLSHFHYDHYIGMSRKWTVDV